MANGVTARLLPFPEPAPAIAQPAAGKPAAARAATEIEVALGPAMADSVEALGLALIDTESGAPLRAEIRTLNGEKLAQIVELRWLTSARSTIGAGLHLQQAAVCCSDGAAQGCASAVPHVPEERRSSESLDQLLSWVLTVASQVVPPRWPSGRIKDRARRGEICPRGGGILVNYLLMAVRRVYIAAGTCVVKGRFTMTKKMRDWRVEL
jgi:hypothetical protein